MEPTADDVHGYVAGLTPPSATRGWYGMCAGLTDRVVAFGTGGSRKWYDSATDARNNSTIVSRDPGKAPPGAIHFWEFWGTAWDGSYGNWGHTAPDIYGGGTDVLSATGYAHEYWALNAGLISVAAQTARGMTYLGWSRTYGAAGILTITQNTPAGDGSRPFEEDDMFTDEDRATLNLLRGFLSSENQVTLFQNAQAIRDRTEGNLSSQHQVEVYQTGNTIRDRVDAILTILGKTPPSGAAFDVEGVAAALREGLGEDIVAALAKQLTK